MRLHRFYISEPIGDKKEIVVDSPELINQIKNVFRLKAGDEVVLFDGSGNDYVCTIVGIPRRNDGKTVKSQRVPGGCGCASSKFKACFCKPRKE